MGAAMHDGIDAQRAMRAFEQSGLGLGEGEARPPHQRAITEYPKLSHFLSRRDSFRKTSSCPALCRASTPLFSEVKFVDGRVKPGHDEEFLLSFAN
jgi:hypothetical protein